MAPTKLVVLASLALAAILGCESPETDSFRRDGGAAPEPAGVLEGSVLYVGPRPSCRFLEDGTPHEVIGNVILLLFDYDNPPPPSGSATSARNLLALSGRDVFSVTDCMPLSPTPDDLRPISRTIDFVWPEIALGTSPMRMDGTLPGRAYQVRGFFDADGDFLPFFSVSNLASAGDIGGGALVDPSAAVPAYLPIAFGHVEDHPDGQRVVGVSVTLGLPITTERPIVQLSESTRALSAEAAIPLLPDALEREEALFQLTGMRVELVRSRETTDGARAFGPALTAAGLGAFDFRPVRHGLPIFPVDANGDGMQDLHPILGSSGVSWYGPIVLLRRARSPMEVATGIPDVLFIATVRPSRVLGVDQGFVPRRTFAQPEIIVPPVAVMVTNPAAPAICRVPIVAPGSYAELYEGLPVVDCQELPTGNYDVNVLSGLAGAVPHDLIAECVAACVMGGTDEATCQASCATSAALASETGGAFDGGVFSSQAWSIPNELGCPDTDYRPTAINQLDPPAADGSLLSCDDPASVLLAHQGREGAFAVVEPDPMTAGDPAATTNGHGVMACTTALHTMGPMAGMVGPVAYRPFPPDFEALCCQPVRHLCGIPLCDARTSADLPGYPEAVRGGGMDGSVRATREIRAEGEVMEVDGVTVPTCVPFLPPAQCCD
jgi:hypothetical protein